MKTILAILTIALLTNCGSSYHLKRAKFHISKAEALGAEWKRDTVFKTLVIKPPTFSADTIIAAPDIRISMEGDTGSINTFGGSFDASFDWGLDTLRLKKKGIDTKVKISPDKVYIRTICDPDTIVREVITNIDNHIDCPECVIKWWWILIAFFIGAAVVFIVKLFTK